MAMNRLTRDEILNRALDRIDSSVLDAKERPSGVILASAMSIGWLQECIDYFQKKFPFQCNIKPGPLVLAQGATTVAVPSDYILDVRNGILLANDAGRLYRKSLNYILNQTITLTGPPLFYTIRTNLIHFVPKANIQYNATIYYYSLDTALLAGVVPNFPDDHILVEFVRLMGREWLHAEPVGTAATYADARIKELQRSGIMQEAEDDQIEFEKDMVNQQLPGPFDWLGKTTG